MRNRIAFRSSLTTGQRSAQPRILSGVRDDGPRLSIEIDPKIVEHLFIAQTVCLVASGIVACLVLAAWFVPALGAALPSFWSDTKANTALIALAATAAFALSHSRQARTLRVISRVLAVFISLVTVFVFIEYLAQTSFRLELLLPHDHASPTGGRMAPPTAIDFCLLSVVLLLLRQRTKVWSAIADITVSVFAVVVLSNAAGWIFGATRLFGIAANNKAGPSTIVCLVLLSFVAFSRRAEYGVFAIILGIGPGSRIARMAFPMALLLPFALETARDIAVHSKFISPAYASAILTTVAVVLAFGLILVLATRMLGLEKEILDLSLRDELTKLYNRRGFLMMAEHALWLARRSRVPFFVLFIDLDGLKMINDTLGHNIGSDFIRETAELLTRIVRESDVVGRVGGDEFVVAGQSEEKHVSVIVDRVTAAAEEQNTRSDRIYPFSLSLGHVSSSSGDSLQELLQQADIAMYKSKYRKQSRRA